jgi:formylglycine-generating enzyme required for sulfatase activity
MIIYYKYLKKMKKINFLVMLLLVATVSAQAQVTIGDTKIPSPFSILELISGRNDNGYGGLRLPQLTMRERKNLSDEHGLEPAMMGLQIFNKNSKCIETWNGIGWIQSCAGEPPLVINPPTHYNPDCAVEPTCTALDGFAVTLLADVDSVFNSTRNTALSAAGAAFTMKPVTGGVFYMGNQTSNSSNPNYGTDDVYPVHQVGVSSFYMGETEVTQGLWTAVMGGHYWWNYGLSSTNPSYDENWYACIAFCNKLSLLLGKTPVYSVTVNDVEVDWKNLTYAQIPVTTATASNANWDAAVCNWSANGFRLPTEAEWEYAARGGQKNEYTRTLGVSGGTQYLYSGSSSVGEVAWYNAGGSGTLIVKNKNANELGLYDMSGNVYEWCWDWYDANSYPTCCDEADPKGVLASGSGRVIRGGAWNSSTNATKYCRVSARTYNSGRTSAIGFRVVLAP